MNSRTTQDYEARIQRTLRFIQQNLDGSLSLQRLAEVAHFSPYHFHRLFRGLTGETLMGHVRRLRLERAAGRLQTGECSVTEAALEAGYEATESFSRAFRSHFGTAPRDWGRQDQPALPPAPSGVHYAVSPDQTYRRPARREEPLPVRILELEPRRVACLRHVGPYDEVGSTWSRLMAWGAPRGFFRPLGLCHDDPESVAPTELRYDACVQVFADTEPEGDIRIQTLPAGPHASFLHRGPYQQFATTYARLCGEWLPDSGRELRGAPAVEIYFNAPGHTAPEDLLTEIQLPLESMAEP